MLKWFAHPLGSVVCRGHVQYPVFVQPSAFAPGCSEMAVGLFGLLISFVQNLSQVLMHAVILSPIQFLYFLAQGMSRCKHYSIAKGPRSQPVSEWAGMVLKFPKCTIIYFQMLHIIYFIYICILNSENAEAAF